MSLTKYNILNFEKISLNLKPIIDKYYTKYGEGSCQHSFVTNFCLKDKYDDMYCEHDSFLYVLRNGLNDDSNRVYLFPMGDKEDEGKIKSAIDNILCDAKNYGKKVIFNSITESSKDVLLKLCDGKFEVEDSNDLYEYVYNVEDLAYLSGPKYYNKRNEVKSFFRKYEGRISIKKIEESDVSSIKDVYKMWMDVSEERNNNTQLKFENAELNIAFDYYNELGIIGLAVYIDNHMIGFIIGAKLNDEYVDAMIEKGDINYKGVYRVLNSEFPKMCVDKYKYINLEEDLGIEGLRNMKLLYHPSHLIKKYVAREV